MNPEIKSFKEGVIEPFISIDYQKHNIARLSHLNSLNLDLNNKSVIEFGAGIGDHTVFYLYRNCKVLPTDARPELLAVLEKRFGIDTKVFNIETDLDDLSEFSKVDIVHCYGILYHISNPEDFLREVSGLGTVLLLETCVSSDDMEDSEYIVSEIQSNPTQAFSGKGCRPTRKWIQNQLLRWYPYVYLPRTQPDHPEFILDWSQPVVDKKKLIRAVFIASHTKIENDNLTTQMPLLYKKHE